MNAPPRLTPLVILFSAVLLPVLLCPAGARAEEGTVFKSKFKVGSEFVIKNQNDMTMQLPVGGSSSEQKVHSEQIITTRVEPHEDGEHKLVKVRIDSLMLDMEMQGMTMRYDSSDPASKDSFLAGPLKGIVNQTVTMVYDENDEFVRLENPEVLGSGAGSRPQMGIELGEEQLKQMVQSQLTGGFTDQPVKEGDSWEQVIKVPLPRMGDLEFRMKYFYRKDGSMDGQPCAFIDVNGTMAGDTTLGTRDDTTGKKSFDAGFKDTKISGTVVFDKEYGVARSTQVDMEMVFALPNPLVAETAMQVPMKQKTLTTLISYSE